MGTKRKGKLGNVISITIFLLILTIQLSTSAKFSTKDGDRIDIDGSGNKRQLIELKDGPDDLVWFVQLSDLHFSIHYPDRAQDFREIMGPTLSFIKPSLVLLTGDLTDGKSKDHITMKQDENEWIEYQEVMQDVVKRSGLNQSIFYDVRGNHDNFGVPVIGGSFDFFSKYSVSGQLQRSGKVNSVTIQSSKRKLLFVGFDSTMSAGLRGPTNLFGHPTDELLTEISSALSQWDSEPVTKVSFGHFPLSFSAASQSGKTLQDVFHAHSLTAYICGHLHTKFGTNLKRRHDSKNNTLYPNQLFQLNGHRTPSESNDNSSIRNHGFWEWEMGDWRKIRSMRILAIDDGRMSFVDFNFSSESKKTIILPTFPLDSRFNSISPQNNPSPIRVLVFSESPIVTVFAKIYDSISGKHVVVMETQMTKVKGSRGDVYISSWNSEAFKDPSPERYFLQIEATDSHGSLTVSELRPFSVLDIPAKLKWSWKEFIVMGCQWDSLYYPILFCFYFLTVSILILPKIILSLSRSTYRDFKSNKGFSNGLGWIFTEFYNLRIAWLGMVVYLFYLVLCPWFYGQVFTEGKEWGYMTYKGWVLETREFFGFPDVMVIVLPHLWFIILPTIGAIMVLACESGARRDYILSNSSKKNDDYQNKEFTDGRKGNTLRRRWLRNCFLVVCLAICYKHSKNCVSLMKAYEMNPILHFPLYCFTVPVLLGYTIWRTR